MLRSNCDAAHDLHSVVNDLEGSVGAEVLAHCSLASVDVAAEVGVGVPGSFVKHVAHGVELDGHVAELQGVQLEASDRLAEGNASPSMLGSVFESRDSRAVVASSNEPALEVEVSDAAVEAVALFAEEVLLFHLDVVEVDLAAGVHTQAQLGERGQRDARLGHVDEELGDDIRVVSVAAHDDEVLNTLGRGDEGLGAVEVNLAVLALVGGHEAGNVRAGARLGASGVHNLLARAQVLQASIDLLLSALADDGVVTGEQVQNIGRGTVLAENLVDRHQRGDGLLKTEATVLFIEHDAVEAHFAKALGPTQPVLVLLVALVEVGLPVLALHVVAIGRHDELLFVGQIEIH